MANTVILASLLLVFTLLSSPFLSNAVSCHGPCQTLDDCDGQLICINGECNDDPDIGTHICTGGGGDSTPSPGSDDCQPSGEVTCNGKTSPTYTCSPPVTSSTAAKLTINDFAQGGDGGGESECDGQYHENSELIVALSTGWYDKGSRCGKMINIVSRNGNSVQAKVVDECDSKLDGCDQEHAYQGPCANNIVDASKGVWDSLGLDSANVEDITWSMA